LLIKCNRKDDTLPTMCLCNKDANPEVFDGEENC